MQKGARTSTLIVAFSLAAGLTSGGPTIVNGSFETGDFTGWTQTPAASGSSFGVSNAVTSLDGPESGSFYAFFGGQQGDYDSISQTLATTPGELYGIIFFLDFDSPNDGTNQDLRLFWNGTLKEIFTSSAPQPIPFYTELMVTVVANASSTVLEFKGFDSTGHTLVDNVSIRDLGPTAPESGTFALAVAGLASFWIFRGLRLRITKHP